MTSQSEMFKMQWGKYRGRMLKDTPVQYIRWLATNYSSNDKGYHQDRKGIPDQLSRPTYRRCNSVRDEGAAMPAMRGVHRRARLPPDAPSSHKESHFLCSQGMRQQVVNTPLPRCLLPHQRSHQSAMIGDSSSSSLGLIWNLRNRRLPQSLH